MADPASSDPDGRLQAAPTEVDLTVTGFGPLAGARSDRQLVHRVGYAPDPWAWTPWQYAHDGRFPGRWDDPDGLWRTLYVADSRLACYLEVLACFRPDPAVAAGLGAVVEDPEDAVEHPTAVPGRLSPDWLRPRQVGSAHLTGWYALPGAHQSLPTLRSQFLSLARQLAVPDLDGAAIRLAQPRELTQQIARWIYQQTDPHHQPVAGVRFASRHGDDLVLWAVFERAHDTTTSQQLTRETAEPLHRNDPELVQALQTHQLSWAQ